MIIKCGTDRNIKVLNNEKVIFKEVDKTCPFDQVQSEISELYSS